MTDRVVTLTRHEILDRRRHAVRQAGLSLPFLEHKQHEHGPRAVAGWLEDHNFYALAEDWVNWAWLLADETPPTSPPDDVQCSSLHGDDRTRIPHWHVVYAKDPT